jgi:hypothetical protein
MTTDNDTTQESFARVMALLPFDLTMSSKPTTKPTENNSTNDTDKERLVFDTRLATQPK